MTKTIHQEAKKAIQKPLWVFPWQYKESFLVAAGILLTGLALQVSTGQELQPLIFPYNAIFMTVFWAGIAGVHFAFKNNSIVKWLRSVPASISSIVLVVFLVMIMGSIPQANFTQGVEKDIFGFSHMTTSWPFNLAMFFFLLTLGFTTINRVFPFQKRNIGFILNHFGLWLTVVSATMGAGDLERLMMDLYEGKVEYRAYDDQGNMQEMPIAFKLKDFKLDEFTPKLGIVNNKTGNLYLEEGNSMRMIEENSPYELMGWEFEVKKYFYESVRLSNGRYEPVNEMGAAPAAKVIARNLATGQTKEGWVSSGSFRRQFEGLPLTDEFSLIMTLPEAKKFSSEVEVFTYKGEKSQAVLEVNKPLEVEGWKVYQLSYDSNRGRWSTLSVVELVRDPWLPIVYLGIAMMLLGAIDIMWTGYKQKNNHE
ncbi:cytochrome c biogenesis protein ResB [Algivirga pacifica]|uniref:Cytochrome c biogenesis protein ResB n=1 Tax=Algivirga pacifica TaxID=1162670 RepID=A0ABP9DCL9_9BACT